ncbi:GWxTD domain-containing protein [bacterium]|nr:GWxTD domain-containing protein [bacterium]
MNRTRPPRELLGGAVLVAATLGVLLASCGPPPAARWAGGRDGALRAWVAVDLGADGRLTPRIEASVPHRDLVFRREGEVYRAGLRVTVTAVRDDRQVGGGVGETEVTVASIAATRTDAEASVSVPLQVRGQDPVRLRVRAVVPGTVRRWDRELALAPGTLETAPLMVARAAADAPRDGADPRAIGLVDEAVPMRVWLVRPATGADWPADGVDLLGEAVTADGRRLGVVRTTIRRAADVPDTLTRDLIWRAADLPFGRHRLQAVLAWRQQGEELRLVHEPAIEVVNERVPVTPDEDWSRHLGWLEGKMPPAVVDSLRSLPAPARRAGWNAAWRDLAAQRGVAPLQAQRRHLRRIVVADDRFGGYGRGALSDRGRVFVRWGEPDAVERAADPRLPGAIWETWVYEDEQRRFHFHDAHGMGDFRLRREDRPPR